MENLIDLLSRLNKYIIFLNIILIIIIIIILIKIFAKLVKFIFNFYQKNKNELNKLTMNLSQLEDTAKDIDLNLQGARKALYTIAFILSLPLIFKKPLLVINLFTKIK